MRLETEVRSESDQYNSVTMSKQLIHEENNSAYNHHIIIESFKSNRGRDVADEPKRNNEPCIILGSGPSLDYSIKFLKDWKYGIICTTSHARTLMYYGIEPTYILVLDPFGCWDEIKGVDWAKTKTRLITHPGVHTSLIENWPNDFVYYIQNTGNPNSFYSTTQKRQYSWKSEQHSRDCTFTYYIKTEVVLFACSPPMQLFMAQLLGYGNVYLCGVDFGYHSGKERFTDYTPLNIEVGRFTNNQYVEMKAERDKEEWSSNEHPYVKKETDIMGKNGVITEDIHLYYKKNFLSAWRLSKQCMFTTDKGLITEVPYIDIEELIKTQDNLSSYDTSLVAEMVEPYLASVGCFVINTDVGCSFVESNNPIYELRQYMEGLDRSYVCKNCKSRFTLNEKMKPIKYDCPTCKKENSLTKACPINIDENMKRIEKLVRPLLQTQKNKKRNERRKLNGKH